MKWLARILLYLVLAAATVGAWLMYALSQPYGRFGPAGVFVEVPRGASARSISALLEQNGVVRSRFAFELLCRWRGRPLQAGEYKFDRARSALGVHRMLAEGRVFLQPLVVPEGKTMFEIAVLVEQAGFASRQGFLVAARDTALVRDLAPRAGSLEGFLFPARYEFPRRATATEIAATMVRRFREEWEKLPGREQPPRRASVAELVTLASLVERETGIPDERALIAGVFYNRLRLGMALECDPTVVYALQLEERYRGALSRGDLKFNSPYNTYRRRGLPPGPIANPGEASLRAALAPAPTDYLYFVANAQGGHFFSRTLREHNANVARYRRLLADNASAQGAAERPGSAKPQKSGRTGGAR